MFWLTTHVQDFRRRLGQARQWLELSLFECPGFGVLLFHTLWWGEPQTVNGFAELSGLIMAYMAARFGVLGVYVSGRSKEKRAAAVGGTAPTVFGQLAKMIAAKK